MDTSNKSGVDAAIKAAGTRRNLAKALGISYEAVRLWHEIPLKRVTQVADITGLSKHQLRPDVFDAPEGRAA